MRKETHLDLQEQIILNDRQLPGDLQRVKLQQLWLSIRAGYDRRRLRIVRDRRLRPRAISVPLHNTPPFVSHSPRSTRNREILRTVRSI